MLHLARQQDGMVEEVNPLFLQPLICGPDTDCLHYVCLGCALFKLNCPSPALNTMNALILAISLIVMQYHSYSVHTTYHFNRIIE